MRKSCIPNVFTFINLSCGVLSLLSTLNNDLITASIFILIAGLVDRYDGMVARYLDVSSELGKELDSLADLVSFGVAPSILTYICFDFAKLGPNGLIGMAILIAFPICGAFRLARYNISTFDGVYTGVPITIVGCFMAAFSLISLYTSQLIYLAIAFMIIGSYLMISNFRFKKL